MFADSNFLAHHHSDPSLCTQEADGCGGGGRARGGKWCGDRMLK